jgi:hypothetical protein
MAASPPISWTTLTVDCSDAEVLGGFYSRVLEWEVVARDGAGWLQLRNPGGGISPNIQAEDAYEAPVWPEQPGRQAKMMHFEVPRRRPRRSRSTRRRVRRDRGGASADGP